MGGFIGLRLAARRPALLRTLTLMNTGADREPWPARIRYSVLAQLVRLFGPGPFTGIAVKALFGETTRHSPDRRAMLEEWTEKLRRRPRSVAEALLGVMGRGAVTVEEMRAIQCPTLVIAGEDDTARPPEDSERLAAFIPGARLVRITGSGHSSALEAPEAVTSAMRGLLGEMDRTSQATADRATG
jgi:pimeloyl-ACP methyl ester carboxylesterase